LTPWKIAHGHHTSDHVITWKSDAGLKPTAVLAGCRSTRDPASTHTTDADTRHVMASPVTGVRRGQARER
jgi:hypothetical protein